ncbi:type III secretion system cytoplasmic ring protein SctQ [Samsonia erythrinae]|uniref:Type III secretion protein Q n=1 Tax=Samsonia erythrinae TaxID=160434 RepID=A0A4V2VTB0_9GAMM|nr:type III secretion system cytoplasmic ring protein SctQ [Samsonia erythrinae]TCV05775.1 type III secretion protein Q [Samsonia erythrinae]
MNAHSCPIRPLKLPTLRAQHARIRSVLASGLTLPFTRDGIVGHLQLQLTTEDELAAQPSQTPVSHWRSDIGGFSLTEPFPALSLLADCPLLPVAEGDGTAQEWYWTLYNQSLNPVLRTLVGEIYPAESDPAIPTASAPRDDGILCGWFCVSWNGIAVRSRMQAGDAVWLALFARADWQRQRRSLSAGISLTIPITLADVILPLPALRTLQVGDIILPNRPWFTPSGEGVLTSGTLRLRGTLQLTTPAPYSFIVTDMETVTMPASTTDTIPTAPDSDVSAFDFAATSDNVTECLPPLPVTLHIRCGSLNMTLAELQHLASGSVLTLRDVVPGNAWLYHGDIALASGELVDVEGRLGLQITQRFPTPAQALTQPDAHTAEQEQAQ